MLEHTLLSRHPCLASIGIKNGITTPSLFRCGQRDSSGAVPRSSRFRARAPRPIRREPYRSHRPARNRSRLASDRVEYQGRSCRGCTAAGQENQGTDIIDHRKSDQIVPAFYAQRLTDLIPSAKRPEIPSGHLSFLEKPVDLASAMSTFLLEKHP
jgi:pimeloyl-ACP methyl ester carboxylesterase